MRLHTTAHRILATLLVSLLLHLAFLFAPLDIQQPEIEPPPPPTLTAKLVALPKIATAPPTPKPPAPHHAPVAAVTPVLEPIADVGAVSYVEAVSNVAEALPNATAVSGIETVSSVATTSSAVPVVATSPVEPTPSAAEPAVPPLPKHAQLRFLITTDTGFQVGEAKHRLEVKPDGQYTLKTSINTTGVFSLIKKYDQEEISTGILDNFGLQPAQYQVNKQTGKGKESYHVVFNHPEKALEFSNGTRAELPARTQDLLSALYQVSQLALSNGKINVPVTNGKKLEHYEFNVGAEQALVTRLGTLRALPLRKIHAANEEGLEIWLGLEYRLLPIKFTSTDRTGKVIAEMIIAEIRVAN